jgi:hypothetical protein
MALDAKEKESLRELHKEVTEKRELSKQFLLSVVKDQKRNKSKDNWDFRELVKKLESDAA